MKKLILIIGPNGVGKTTTAEILLQKLSKCAYVDADWCRAIFPYGFHGERKQIFEQVIGSLREDGIPFEICPIILKCSKEENIRRTINDGRDMERIERGIKDTFYLYDEYAYPNIDSTYLQPEQTAEKIIEQIKK